MTTQSISEPKAHKPKHFSFNLEKEIQSACAKIPPLWPLKNFVAVNPFLGLRDMRFHDACRLIHRVGHGDMVLPGAHYQKAFQDGEITLSNLNQASSRIGGDWSAPELLDALSDPWPNEILQLSVADALDLRDGSQWQSLIVDEVSKWMAAYYDDGQTLWPLPWKSMALFPAWKKGAEMDRTLEALGVKGFRSIVKALPEDPLEAIQWMTNEMDIPGVHVSEYFHRLLMTIRGWAGHVQYRVREKSMQGQEDASMIHALAIRLTYDYVLFKKFGPLEELFKGTFKSEIANHRAPALAVWQDALEIAHRNTLLQRLKAAAQYQAERPFSKEAKPRPSFQAVFCIDVRSEVFRRAIEGADPQSKTIGFAGFFGFPIAVKPLAKENLQSRCPVLLSPAYQINECACGDSASSSSSTQALEKSLNGKYLFKRIWKSFKTASITCFSFVESLGLAYLKPLIQDSLAIPSSTKGQGRSFQVELDNPVERNSLAGIPLEKRIALAEGALKNMGLTKNFSRLVLICGHGSQTKNNPFGSSLDCGACGGHAGDANARVAVSVFNEPAVREGLLEKGISIPEDTRFIAGMHLTINDEVELFDTDRIPETHQQDLADLQSTLKLAGEVARLERSGSLGIKTETKDELKASIASRASDWAQVRPEWGLAGNYAFIAAPRERIQHLKLDGRVFLHNYDPIQDPEFNILELIMVAPMVVANWINLQYFGSAANNELFGSGDKVLHNVVGKIGVLEGNGGDLKTGLPMQSVHDGEKLVHLPLRLNVILEAPTAAIDKILEKHQDVRHLVEKEWLFLHSMEEEGLKLQQRQSDGNWHLID